GVDDRFLVQNKSYRASYIFPETPHLYGQLILSDRKSREIESTILLCAGCPGHVRIQIADGNHCPGNDRTALIRYEAGERPARCLSIRRNWNEASNEQQENPPNHLRFGLHHNVNSL